MTSEQIASLRPALAKLVKRFSPCFERHKTLGYLEKYILGLLSDVKRKSIEPIALAVGVAVRTLQEFMAFFCWDEERAGRQLIRMVADEHGRREGIGALDSSDRRKWQIGLEQVADAANTLAWNIWSRWPHSWALLKQRCEYYQWRNQLSYASRKRTQRRNNTQPNSS